MKFVIESSEKDDQPASPPLTAPKLPSFLDTNSEVGPHFFELSRSMSAPPAEFLSSIQNVILAVILTFIHFYS